MLAERRKISANRSPPQRTLYVTNEEIVAEVIRHWESELRTAESQYLLYLNADALGPKTAPLNKIGSQERGAGFQLTSSIRFPNGSYMWHLRTSGISFGSSREMPAVRKCISIAP